MKTFSISIPKPCHEDWNKMTPDAKGAFCASCQKSVHDFSNKTDEEIISVFENKGEEKICGRFKPSQLSQPVVSFGEPSSTSRLAKFLYALLLAFGSSLFVGGNAFGQNVKGEPQLMGKPSYRPVNIEQEPVKTTETMDTVVAVKHNTPVTCGLRNPDSESFPLGQAVVFETPAIYGDTIIAPEEMMGLVEEIDTMELIEPEPMIYVSGNIVSIAIIETPLSIIDTAITAIPEEEVIPAEENAIVAEETEEIKSNPLSETILAPALEMIVRPNPSKGEIILSYTLKNDMPVKIDLYDAKGIFIKNLSSNGKQYAGTYNVSYDLSELQNGIYNAVLITADRKVSSKIVLAK